MTFVGRMDAGHGEPVYVFRSPCCGVKETVSAWSVTAAVHNRDGRILLQCGRTATDPLRAAGTGRIGCGKRFEVDCSNLDDGPARHP